MSSLCAAREPDPDQFLIFFEQRIGKGIGAQALVVSMNSFSRTSPKNFTHGCRNLTLLR